VTRAGTVLTRAERLLVVANQAVIVGLMMLMAGLVFANVVTRYVFGFSLNWSEEIARYAMVWITYLGAGLAMREGQHVAIEYLQSVLPRPWQPYVRAVVWLIILAFLTVFTVAGFQFSSFAWRQRSPVMGWRMGAVYLTIPLGTMLFALHLIIGAREFVMKDINADELAADAARQAGADPVTADPPPTPPADRP